MLHAYDQRFDVTENLENFCERLTEIYHKFVRPLAADSPHWQIEVAGRPASTGISTAASRQDHAWRYGMGTGQAAPSIDHLAAACRKPGTVPLQICMCCCGSVTCPAGHLFNSSGATVQVEPANWVVGAVQATSACQLRRKAQLLSLCFACYVGHNTICVLFFKITGFFREKVRSSTGFYSIIHRSQQK